MKRFEENLVSTSFRGELLQHGHTLVACIEARLPGVSMTLAHVPMFVVVIPALREFDSLLI